MGGRQRRGLGSYRPESRAPLLWPLVYHAPVLKATQTPQLFPGERPGRWHPSRRQQWGLEVEGQQIIPSIHRLCIKPSRTPSPNHRSRLVPSEGSGDTLPPNCPPQSSFNGYRWFRLALTQGKTPSPMLAHPQGPPRGF